MKIQGLRRVPRVLIICLLGFLLSVSLETTTDSEYNRDIWRWSGRRETPSINDSKVVNLTAGFATESIWPNRLCYPPLYTYDFVNNLFQFHEHSNTKFASSLRK